MMQITIQEAFHKAVGAHRDGRIEEAGDLYQAILHSEPGHPDANHNMGVLLAAAGKPDEALSYFWRALEADPQYPLYWTSCVEMLVRSQQIDLARQTIDEGKRLGLPTQDVERLLLLLDTHSSNQGNATQKVAEKKETFTEKRKRLAGKKEINLGSQPTGQRTPYPHKQPAGPRDAEVAPLVAAFNSGNVIVAKSHAEALVKKYPLHPFGWKALGTVLHLAGNFAPAIEALEKSIAINPADAEAHGNLGVILKDCGRLADAEARYRHALRLRPNYPEALSNIAVVLHGLGRTTEAETACRNAILQNPNHAEAYNNLALILKSQGQTQEAETCCRKAIDLVPNYAEAHNNLGNIFKDLGRYDEAMVSCQEAIRLNPTCAEAYNNLGAALTGLHRLEEAQTYYRHAIQLKPQCADAHGNLGAVLKDFGYVREAKISYQAALHLQPREKKWLFSNGLMLPKISSSSTEIEAFRLDYARSIEDLRQSEITLENPGAQISNSTFDLAYHGHDNKEVVQSISLMFRERSPAINFISPHLNQWTGIQGNRIKIGICSEFLSGHTIGKLYQGLVSKLDKTRFEVTVIHSSKSKRDDFTSLLNASADSVIHLPSTLKQQQCMVSDAALDILFYPDIGMSAETYFLAHSRLAPVQAASWGHPDTTGINTIDYFISSRRIEPEQADEQYSERLIKLSGLPSYYEHPSYVQTLDLDRHSFGLPAHGRLYGCPQSLFKLHPEFDAALAKILELDSSGHIVLLEGMLKQWSGLLRARWAESYPILMERVIFLPRQPLDRFMALIRNFDVLLDPIHFGSGNTMYESLVHGIPIVTWRGQFMRGRIVAGAYEQMQLPDAPIASTLNEYAETAVAWAKDTVRCEAFRQTAVAAARQRLFSDETVVKEFENFFTASVQAAANGVLLERGWNCSV